MCVKYQVWRQIQRGMVSYVGPKTARLKAANESGVTECNFLKKMAANCMDGTDKDATIKKKSVMLDGCIPSKFQINEARNGR